MIELFDISDINKSAAAFNLDKLLWLNQHYINNLDLSRVVTEVGRRMKARGISVCSGPGLVEVVDVLRSRVQTLEELVDQAAFLYTPVTSYDSQAVAKHIGPETQKILEQAFTALSSLDEWETEAIAAAIKKIVGELGVKFPQVAQPLRIAISGSVATPSIDVTLKLAGRDRTLERIENALEYFRKSA